MSSSTTVEHEENEDGPRGGENNEEDSNQPQDVEDVEMVTNMKLYLIEAMRNKKNDELAEFVLYKEVLNQVQKMENIPSYATDAIHGKQKLVAELNRLKEKHLRKHYFFDQLLGVMLKSPDSDEMVTPTLVPIYRSVFIDRDGNKLYN
jgi:hypothetical protein